MSEFEVKLSKRIWWLILPVLIGLFAILLVSQKNLPQPQDLELAEATQIVTTTPTEGSWGRGCMVKAVAVAWVDEDGDGIRDPEEPPLSGVTFFVDDTLSSFNPEGEEETDWYGEARFAVELQGCPTSRYEVYPEIPSGYQLTTEYRPSASYVRQYERFYTFGFAYLPQSPTVTPRPPLPACSSYEIIGNQRFTVTDIEAAPDGTVWVARTMKGVAQYLPDLDEWVPYTTTDGLISDQVLSIAVSDQNVIWFGTRDGVSRFDGDEWSSYTVQDGLVGMYVGAITPGKSGDVWFGTTEGASHFDPATGIWESFTEEDGLAYQGVNEIAIMPDGSIMFFTLSHGASRLMPEDDFSGGPSWEYYDISLPVADFTISPDGIYWFAGYIGPFSFDPETESWYYDYVFQGVYGIEAAEDGTIWFVSSRLEIGNVVLNRLSKIQEDNASWEWEMYDTAHDQIIPQEYLIKDDEPIGLTITPDGAIWIATKQSISRCVFPDQ
jgi:streptogramin lyase